MSASLIASEVHLGHELGLHRGNLVPLWRCRLLLCCLPIEFDVQEGYPALYVIYVVVEIEGFLKFGPRFHHLVAVRVGKVGDVVGLACVDRFDLLVVEPNYPLAVLPEPEL